jgi:ribosomal protein L21E
MSTEDDELRQQAARERQERERAQGVAEYKRGDRVQLHMSMDAWLRGDRYGTVTHTTKVCVVVRMDKSGRIKRVAPELLMRVT